MSRLQIERARTRKTVRFLLGHYLESSTDTMSDSDDVCVSCPLESLRSTYAE
jgi:hypothetical protein